MTDFKELVKVLNNGGVAVVPTDTIYGIVARAYDKAAVEKVFKIKQRDPAKKCIVLVANYDQAKELGVTDEWLDKTKTYWPGPFSLVLPTTRTDIEQLERSTGMFGFRMPNNIALIKLMEQTGPLIAPSANPESLPPANNINEAKAYFGGQIDLYIDGGELANPPSTLIDLVNHQTIR
jgi:L-threonylcarbamoyladenylate synthase